MNQVTPNNITNTLTVSSAARLVRRMPKLNMLRLMLGCGLLLSVASCGFTPRQASPIPQALASMQLQANPETQALANSFRVASRHLDLAFEEQADIRLELQRETVTRRLLSVFASGQVAEYELAYELRYVLHAHGQAVPRTIQILRDYQDDPKQVLAKSLELELIMTELRQRAVQQVVAYLPRHYDAALMQAQ